MLEIAIFN